MRDHPFPRLALFACGERNEHLNSRQRVAAVDPWHRSHEERSVPNPFEHFDVWVPNGVEDRSPEFIPARTFAPLEPSASVFCPTDQLLPWTIFTRIPLRGICSCMKRSQYEAGSHPRLVGA